MTTLIRREFVVDASLEAAWGHLARVGDWPSWAKHIERIGLDPPGETTADSIGVASPVPIVGMSFGACGVCSWEIACIFP